MYRPAVAASLLGILFGIPLDHSNTRPIFFLPHSGVNSFSAMVANPATTHSTIVISSAMSVAANTTVSADRSLRFTGEGTLNVASGATVTILSNLIAPADRQIFSGAGKVAGLHVSRPEWFGSAATVKTAIDALDPVNGGTVFLQLGTYRSGTDTTRIPVSTPHVDIEGTGMPGFNSKTAPTALIGGTIIQGTFAAMQGADYLTVRNVGFDVGPAFVNANYGGVAVDAFDIYNAGAVIGAPPVQSPLLENLSCLGYSLSAPFHCMLVENVDHATVRNTAGVYNQHGAVLKGTNSVWNGDYERGHSIDSFILKSDNYAPSGNDQISHVTIAALATPGDTQGMILSAQTALLAHATVSDLNAGAMSGNGLQIDGGGTIISDIVVSNVTADYLSASPGGACISLQSKVVRVSISNLDCGNYFIGIGASALTATDIAVTNAHFSNISYNAIVAQGYWTVSNSSFVNIGQNGVYHLGGGVVTVSGNSFRSLGGVQYYSASGTSIFQTGDQAGVPVSSASGTSPVQSLQNSSYNTSSGNGSVMIGFDSANEGGAMFGAYKTPGVGQASSMGFRFYCERGANTSALCATLDPDGNWLMTGKVSAPGIVTTNGISQSSALVTMNASHTPVPLEGTGTLSGILILRDNTFGGTALYLVDPNTGINSIQSAIKGISVTLNEDHVVQIELIDEAVPRTIAWSFIAS